MGNSKEPLVGLQQQADVAALALLDTLDDAYEEAYLGDIAAVEASAVDSPMAEIIDETSPASGVFDAQIEEIKDDANIDLAVTVDAVMVEQFGELEITSAESNKSTVAVDVQITRHLAEDDIDWVQVVPYVLTIDTVDSSIVDMEVPDLEDLIAQENDNELAQPRALIGPAEYGGAFSADTAALSTTNRQKVADYATNWAITPYKAYATHTQDCTNFVSQTLKAGGWASVTGFYTSNNAWWYSSTSQSRTWINADQFYLFATGTKRATTAASVSALRVGDLLLYKYRIDNPGMKMSHAMVVTKKTNSETYLSYHTYNTRNEPYSKMKSRINAMWFPLHV